MFKKRILHTFIYQYNAGPLSFDELSKGDFNTGNCRRAIQDYLYCKYDTYLTPEEILLPQAYKEIGIFITENGEVNISLYKDGDIVYAERIKDKNNKKIDKNRNTFRTEDEWIYQFHSAVYIGNISIYHATAIAGGTCMWSLDTFQKYYKIIAVKRVLEM